MNGIIDFHSHILPGIDDGSSSVEESITMLRMETDQGINCVVATPHFYPMHDSPERFLSRRSEAEKRLWEAMEGQEKLPQIIIGAEVYFFPGISNCDSLPELTIGQKKCILIEMPYVPWTKSMYSELEEIQARWGITPIIAHVDRYFSLLSTYDIPQRLAALPVLVQANASFFIHSLSRRRALRMLECESIHLLGSDCHNVNTRMPNLNKALQIVDKYTHSSYIEKVCNYQKMVLSDT